MRGWRVAFVAAGVCLAGMTTAEARPFDPEGRVQFGRDDVWSEGRSARRAHPRRQRTARARRADRAYRHRDEDSGGSRSNLGAGSMRVSGVGPRPRQWCGWWMRTQLGGGPEFNLAWNWRKYGRSARPQVGAIVVWRHHVGMIVGRASNGRWIVRSGNDGGRVRTRVRSVAGAIFRI